MAKHKFTKGEKAAPFKKGGGRSKPKPAKKKGK